jgi:DNA polymerase elongation subunit (family B)
MKILFLDIETAPKVAYVWGLFNQNIAINQIVEAGYTLCWSAQWNGSKDIYFSSIQRDGMKKMLNKLHKLLNEADAVVHYNGTRFDIPMINREFLKYEMSVPDPYHQIDLYRVVKQRFKFDSNKLDWVCQELGIGAKVQHKGMELWHDCMNGDEKSWRIMERYNKQDVRLLPKLYKKLLQWIKNHPNHALYTDETRPVCPNCGSVHVVKKGVETTATMQYQRYRCTDCKTPIRGRTNIMTKEKKAAVLVQSKL